MRLRRVKVGGLALFVAVAGQLTVPTMTAAGVVDCPDVPLVGQACDAGNAVVDNTAGRALNGVKDIAGGAAQAVGGSILDLIAKAIASAAVWFLQQIAGLVGGTTQIHLTDVSSCIGPHGAGSAHAAAAQAASCDQPASWFGHRYGAMWGLATIFALGLLFVVVLESGIRGNVGVLANTALVKLPLAFIFTGAAIAVTGMLLQLTDEMSAAIAGNVGADAGDFFGAAGKALTALAAGTGAVTPIFVVLVAALVIVVGAFFVWLELLMRAASIYVVVFFLPFAFAAMIWPRTAGVLRRVIELLLVLIFSKFVIVAILSLATGALGNADVSSGSGVSQVFGGGAILVLAAFSPFVLFKLVPFVEGAAIGGVAGRGAATAGALAAVTASPARVMRNTISSNWHRQPALASAGGDGRLGAATSRGAPPPRAPAPTPGGGGAGARGGGAGVGAAGASAGAAGAGAAALSTAAGAGPAAAQRLGRTGAGQVGAQRSGPPVAPPSREHGRPSVPAPEESPARPPRDALDQDRPEGA